MGSRITRQWRRNLLVAVAAAAVACAGRAPAEPDAVEPEPVIEPAPAPVAAPEPAAADAAALATCVEACEGKNMARAVAADVITADCEAFCGGTPLLYNGSDLGMLVGLRVAVVGSLAVERVSSTPDPIGSAVLMDDGTHVWVTEGGPPAGWDAAETPFTVTGILRAGEGRQAWRLEDYTAPVPYQPNDDLVAPPIP